MSNQAKYGQAKLSMATYRRYLNEYDTIGLYETEKYRRGREHVKKIVRGLKQANQEYITAGAMGRMIDQAYRDILEAVLLDLCDERVLRWNPKEVAPSRVYLL